MPDIDSWEAKAPTSKARHPPFRAFVDTSSAFPSTYRGGSSKFPYDTGGTLPFPVALAGMAHPSELDTVFQKRLQRQYLIFHPSMPSHIHQPVLALLATGAPKETIVDAIN
jgi:hypothetical protein